jgi:hypothetical protein
MSLLLLIHEDFSFYVSGPGWGIAELDLTHIGDTEILLNLTRPLLSIDDPALTP